MVRYVVSPVRSELQRSLDELSRSQKPFLTFIYGFWFVLCTVLPLLAMDIVTDYVRFSANVVWAVVVFIVAGAMVWAYYKREHKAMDEVRRLYGKEVVNGDILFVDTDTWRRYERWLRRTGQSYDPHELFRWQERANINRVGRNLTRFLRHN